MENPQSEEEAKNSILSEGQTLKLMDEIMNSKQFHNEKALKKKEAFQTGEEFLSTFFTDKYKMKTLAANWSVKFIRSLNLYSKKNSMC